MPLIDDKLREPQAKPQTAKPQAPMRPAPPPTAAPGGANPQGSHRFKTKVIDAIPQELRDDFERLVLVGMKILYSPKMKKMIEKELAKPGPAQKKLAEGVAGLMALIDTKAKKGIPREIIIPAAIELMHEVADFLQSIGRAQFTPDQLQEATMYLSIIIAKRYGASDQQIQQMFQGQGQPAQAPGAAAAPPQAAGPVEDEEEEVVEEEEE